MRRRSRLVEETGFLLSSSAVEQRGATYYFTGAHDGRAPPARERQERGAFCTRYTVIWERRAGINQRRRPPATTLRLQLNKVLPAPRAPRSPSRPTARRQARDAAIHSNTCIHENGLRNSAPIQLRPASRPNSNPAPSPSTTQASLPHICPRRVCKTLQS